MGKKVVLFFIAAVSFVLLNVFSRFLYEQSWFSSTSFAKELDPFDIITLVITTIVTIWFGIYISKKLTEQRFQKEYVINDLRAIEDELAFIEKSIVHASSIELNAIIQSLCKLKICIDRCSSSLSIFSIKNIDMAILNKSYTKLYSITTDVDGDRLFLPDVKKNEISLVCNDFILNSRSIVCKINNQ